MTSAIPTFRDPTRLTAWLVGLLYAYAAICVLWLVIDAMQLQLLASAPYSLAEAEANDTRQRVVSVLYLAELLATVIVFVVWTYRANLNARQLGAVDMNFTPGWAAGWYFVPIAFLWKPYQAMKEIWQASKNPAAWSSERRSVLLPWWWLSWIATCLLGNFAFRASMSAHTVDQLKLATVLNVAASTVAIPSAIIVAALVREISSMQVSHAGVSHNFQARVASA